MKKPIRVLIVEDSALMRRELARLIDSDPDCHVIATASDGRDGLEKVKTHQPDVVTLDINLPGMDGLTCLQYIMIESPRPCIMISALTGKDSLETFEALELGAVDFIRKPSGEISRDIDTVAGTIVRKIKAAAQANLSAISDPPQPPQKTEVEKTQRPMSPLDCVVVIGVSTGGPRTLMKILPGLSADLGAPVLIIQHMPPKFTASFSQRLDQHCPLKVKEARHNEPLLANGVYVAPGGFHLRVKKDGSQYILRTERPGEKDTLIPSVDKTMGDCIDIFGNRTVGVILTGMGSDGSESMRKLFQMGGFTIAESKSSAIIYGMPKEVIERGAARKVVAAEQIAGAIMRGLKMLKDHHEFSPNRFRKDQTDHP